jgi:hypothetical protein
VRQTNGEMKELTLTEALQAEIENQESRYEHTLFAGKPIEELQIIQKEIEYLKITLQKVQKRYIESETILR